MEVLYRFAEAIKRDMPEAEVAVLRPISEGAKSVIRVSGVGTPGYVTFLTMERFIDVSDEAEL